MDWFVEIIAWINNHYQTHAWINYTIFIVENSIGLYFYFKTRENNYVQTLCESAYVSSCLVVMATYFPDIVFNFVLIGVTITLFDAIRMYNKYQDREEYKNYPLSKKQIRNSLMLVYLPTVFCILCGFIML